MAKDKKSSVGVVHVLQGKRLVQKKLQLFATVFHVKSIQNLNLFLVFFFFFKKWILNTNSFQFFFVGFKT